MICDPALYTGVSKPRVQWTNVDDDEILLDELSLKPLVSQHNYGAEGDGNTSYDYALAVTGNIFRWMLNNAPVDTVHRVSNLGSCIVSLPDSGQDVS